MHLQDFFKQNPRVALAFSGGVDSAYLLYAAMQCGADITAYYVKSAFQPQFELDDAQKLAAELGARMKVLPLDVLADVTIAANPADRCYHCKRRIIGTIMAAARADGYTLLIDGTNASDAADDRPGMRALAEMQVRSPLREAGITKAEIRQLSQEAGLFTWNKPAYACLATRIPQGQRIDAEQLAKIENAENYLMHCGFSNFRVRISGNTAKLQLTQAQLPLLLEKRTEILTELKKHFSSIVLDLEVRDE